MLFVVTGTFGLRQIDDDPSRHARPEECPFLRLAHDPAAAAVRNGTAGLSFRLRGGIRPHGRQAAVRRMGRRARAPLRDVEAGDLDARGRSADLILDIDVQGAKQIMASGIPAVFVFVLPPRFEDLARRLRGRGEDKADVIARRLRNARTEVRQAGKFEYLIVNDQLDRAVLELESIILANRCRRDARRTALREALESFK